MTAARALLWFDYYAVTKKLRTTSLLYCCTMTLTNQGCFDIFVNIITFQGIPSTILK